MAPIFIHGKGYDITSSDWVGRGFLNLKRFVYVPEPGCSAALAVRSRIRVQVNLPSGEGIFAGPTSVGPYLSKYN
jgi:hypothetical protein